MSSHNPSESSWRRVKRYSGAKDAAKPLRRTRGYKSMRGAEPIRSNWREDMDCTFENLIQRCRTHVKRALASSKSYGEFKSCLKRAKRHVVKHPDVWLAMMVASVHLLSECDDLKMCESLLKDATAEECARICNEKMGRNGYTALFRAAYKGSLRMMKLLCGYGGDVRMRNTHDETVLDTIRLGMKHTIESMPSNAMFIRERFEECEKFVVKKMEAPVKPTVVRMRVPRRLQLAGIRIKWWWRARVRARASAAQARDRT